MLPAQRTLVTSELGLNQTYMVNLAQPLLKVTVICDAEQFYKSVVIIFDLVADLWITLRLDVVKLIENYTWLEFVLVTFLVQVLHHEWEVRWKKEMIFSGAHTVVMSEIPFSDSFYHFAKVFFHRLLNNHLLEFLEPQFPHVYSFLFTFLDEFGYIFAWNNKTSSPENVRNMVNIQ